MRPHRWRDVETLLLPTLAAVPLYFTGAIGPIPLGVFHAAMLAMILRVASGRSPEIIPESVLRAISLAYVPLYIVDAVINHAIAASTHLVLFIAVYQPIESSRRENRAQRLLTAALIFIASLSTSTDITIILFVIAWSFLMFRQLMLLSHLETAAVVGREYADPPSSRAAAFYLCGTTLLAALLFPVIPRIRNPIVHGLAGTLSNATTGLSNSIDFNQNRTSTPDASVVARIWMGQEAIPFFTPLRLRANVYDRYFENEWRQSMIGFRPMRSQDGGFRIARPRGFTRTARVQQRLIAQTKLFLPTGTYAVNGIQALAEGPARDTYVTFQPGRDQLSFDVSLAEEVDPLKTQTPAPVVYPATPGVAALARTMARGETDPRKQARAVERYLLSNYQYLQKPEQIGHPMSVDEFLLKEKRGHCEYFAAGMVAVMSSLGVPARIVGGFYGGRLNPLTGYLVVRREDAHAWTEVWTGASWETFDATPASLRPGNAQAGLLSTYAAALSDSVNYFWDRYVLTFGLGDQIALAARAFARVRDALSSGGNQFRTIRDALTARRLLEGIGFIGSLILLLWLARRKRASLFEMVSVHLGRLGVAIGPAMTLEEALAALRAEDPAAALELEAVVALYEAERFSAQKDRSRAAAIRRRLAELRA